MTRFIMSLEEAVDLVLFAFEHGQNGDILCSESTSLHHPDPGRGRMRACLAAKKRRYQGHRHPSRREDVRNSPH